MMMMLYLEIWCIVFEEVVVRDFVVEGGVEKDRSLVGPAARHIAHRISACKRKRGIVRDGLGLMAHCAPCIRL